MKNDSPQDPNELKEFTFTLSGLSRNKLLIISRSSRILAIVGISSLILFFIILIGSHLAFMDSQGEAGSFVTGLIKYAVMAFFMLYACYNLLLFSGKTSLAMANLNDGEFHMGLKYLREFILYTVMAALTFVIVSLIEMYFLN